MKHKVFLFFNILQVQTRLCEVCLTPMVSNQTHTQQILPIEQTEAFIDIKTIHKLCFYFICCNVMPF